MSNSALIRFREDAVIKTLAPVIPIKAGFVPNNKEKRKDSKTKSEKNTPLIYNKPIYKSKKYDLL